MHQDRILFQIPQPGQGQLPWMLYRLRDIRKGSYRAAPASVYLGAGITACKTPGKLSHPFGQRLEAGVDLFVS